MITRPARASILGALLALGACVASSHASPVPDFTCKVLPHPLLQADGYLLGENIYLMGDSVGLVGYADISEQLPQIVSGSGMQFSNGQITFAAKGDSGFLEMADGTQFPCTAHVEAAGQSVAPTQTGGTSAELVSTLALAIETIVRSGPNVAAQRIEKLPLNEPVTLLRETGVYIDDYQWFEIEYSEGRRGYAWGGTMCVDTEISGILIDCTRFAGVTAHQRLTGALSSNTQNGQIAGRSLFGSKVRNAPDPNARQIASIAEGAPIRIVQETGSFFDGWQWVRIRYGNGSEGYVWGGTICVTSGRTPAGVHDKCN